MTSWRLAAPIDDIRAALLEAGGTPQACAIATLVEVSGSAPRDVGAQMLITADRYWGFLSGGCIEADVARHGREAMAAGAPRLLRYGEGSPWIDIRLACGSGITVLVEPLAANDRAFLTLMEAHAARAPVLWRSDGSERSATLADHAPPVPWDGTHYHKQFEPTLRLILIGDDATALASAALALELGWDAVLIAPGGPDEAPFTGMTYYRSAPPEALNAIGVDRWTAIAVLSHDREDDELALARALQSAAFHVGAIGARTRLDGRLAKLRAHGVTEAQLARLHAPIGLQGFGKAPRDIALSLVAEVGRAFHASSAAVRSPGESMSNSAPAASVSQ